MRQETATKWVALLLAAVMAIAILPGMAMAGEPCTLTEGCTLEAGHEGACVTAPDGPETPGEPTAAEQIQARINALPDVSALAQATFTFGMTMFPARLFRSPADLCPLCRFRSRQIAE